MLSHLRHVLLGQIVPGALVLVALWAWLAAVGGPANALMLKQPGVSGWIILTVAAYVAGVLAQVVASLVERRLPSPESVMLGETGDDGLPTVLVNAARRKLGERLDLASRELEPRWIYRLCHVAVQQSVDPGRLPPYRTLEGLCQGTAVSLALLGPACMALAIRQSLAPASEGFALHPGLLLAAALVQLPLAILSYRAGRRYGRLRVRHAVLAFLVLENGDADISDRNIWPRKKGRMISPPDPSVAEAPSG